MNNDIVHGTVRIAIQRFIAKYPLLGGVLAACNIRYDPTIDTMAVGWEGFNFILYYNADFVVGLSMYELVGVIHHEVRHLVYDHVFMKPEMFPDENALTVAQKVTANENIPEKLPGNAMTLKSFPKLKPNQDTETRYNKLTKPGAKTPQTAAGESAATGELPSPGQPAKPTSGSTDDSGTTCSATRAGGQPGQTAGGSVGGSAGGSAGNSAGSPASSQAGGQSGKTVDDHSRWKQAQADETFARAIVQSALHDAAAQVPELSEYDKTVISEVCRQRGVDPGRWLAEVARSRAPRRLVWAVLLRLYVGECVDKSATLARPPRRSPHLLGVVPGSASVAQRPRILAVIDTSASMSDDILGDICRELAFMARDRKVWVVECDAEIQAVYRYRKPIDRVARYVAQHQAELTEAKLRRERMERGRLDAPQRRAERFARKYGDPVNAIPDAANALFNLNRYAKNHRCNREHRGEIYDLKNGFLRLLCERGYVTTAHIHVRPDAGATCRDCQGSGTSDHDDECGADFGASTCCHCGGTGWFRAPGEERYVCFVFEIAGQRYCWHQQERLVKWPYPKAATPDAPMPQMESEKPVALKPGAFATAKSLIRFALQATESAPGPCVQCADW